MKLTMQDPIRDILDDIRRIVRALRMSSRSNEKSHGVSAAQLYVLSQLHQLEAEQTVSINDLAARTLTHQSSVSVVVSKLVEQKLVSRRTSAQDSRRVELRLTEQGKRKLKQAPRPIQEDLVAALKRMPASDRVTLAMLLSKLVSEAGFAQGRPPLLFEDEPDGALEK